jgi:hypothetical protein
MMKVYQLFTFGKLPEDECEGDGIADYGEISQGIFVSLWYAQSLGERLLLESAKPGGTDAWVKEARAWAVDPRERPRTDRLHLWSFLPSAAGSEPGEWYPQARTTSIWIKTLEVNEATATDA